jgi:rubrerythrin
VFRQTERKTNIDGAVIGEECMDYRCDDCGFMFRRVSEIQMCPFCEGPRIRCATEEEAQSLMCRLEKKRKFKEEETA